MPSWNGTLVEHHVDKHRGGGLLTVEGAQIKGSAKASYGPWSGREGEGEGLGMGKHWGLRVGKVSSRFSPLPLKGSSAEA